MARVLFRITAKTIVTEISVSLPATDLGKPGKVCAWMPGASPPVASRIGANINKGQGIKAKVEDPLRPLALTLSRFENSQNVKVTVSGPLLGSGD